MKNVSRVSNMFSRGDQTSDPFPSYLNLQPRFGFIAIMLTVLYHLNLSHFIPTLKTKCVPVWVCSHTEEHTRIH